MSHMAGFSVSVETENQVEEFITDVRGIIVGFGAVSHKGDERGGLTPGKPPEGPSLLAKTVYGRDRLIYQRALRVGLALAGQVVFGGDIMVE